MCEIRLLSILKPRLLLDAMINTSGLHASFLPLHFKFLSKRDSVLYDNRYNDKTQCNH